MVELNTSERQPKNRGQAMVEYALILVLLAIAFGFAIAATGPAIGNVFCNVVHNIGGDTASPQGGSCGSTAPDLAGEGGNPPLFWATVTWVAQHPQGETPFPTPIRRPASGSGPVWTNTPTWTYTPSNTPTNTPSNTPSNTPTNTPTNTPGPSATITDIAFEVPHVDQVSNPLWWRLDGGLYLDNDASWTGEWFNNLNNRTNPTGWSLDSSSLVGTTLHEVSDLGMNWGAGTPPGTGVTNTDDYGARFTRLVDLDSDLSVIFNISASSYGRLIIDGSTELNVNGTTTSITRTLLAGPPHTIVFEYGDNASSTAGFSLTTTITQINPDDPAGNPSTCTWERSGNANDPVSISWQFDENPGSDTWPANQTCYLELRGYVDITGKTNPIMLSFWDIWDFSGGSGMSVALQVGKYTPDGSGGVDRGAFNWQTIPLHTSGANYNWTRQQIDLRAEAPALTAGAEYVALRFVISSGAGGGGNPVRWYIDDLEIVDDTTPTNTFTVRDSWTLDDADQMDDFIFDGDSNRLINKYSLPNTTEAWRWDLTTTNAHSGMAWDDSPTGNYQDHSQAATGQQRVHYLEFRYPIDLTTSRLPAVPASDTDGDTGVPLLTFWQAFDIQPNASIRVQYTNDLNDELPDTWIDIPAQGVLIDYTTPTGANRTNLTMHPVEIDLTNIPNALTQKFRLRFALYVDGAATAFGDGWYIDDIQIERENPSPFFAYPFADSAESPADTADWWDAIGGEWGVTTEKGGVNGSANAYADSPFTTYDPNDTQILQLHYAIDLNHDSPNNTLVHPAASNPILEFWHQRGVQSGISFRVELWTQATGWDAIWTYDSASDSSFRTQNAWERAEINLVTALENVTGKSWATITGNGDSPSPIYDDDDIKIRFVLAPGSATAADGVYVDNIYIHNGATQVHKLWSVGSGGNGAFVDSIESATNFAGPWQERWYHGGAWDSTSTSGYTRTGSQALTDSPGSNYSPYTFSVLELSPQIDMTSTASGSYPTLTFWTRYAIGSDANFRVEIAYQDGTTGSNQSSYDQIGGWSAWSARPVMLDNSAATPITNTSVVTWQRGQVDLTSFIGKRIRVRFVVSNATAGGTADGMYVDEVAFTYSPNQYTLPFSDSGQSLVNWVAEGTWGLGQNYFAGTGTSAADFGGTSWVGTYFDCEGLGYSGSGCGSPSTYSTMLVSETNYLPTDPFVQTGPKIGPEIISDVNFNWVDPERPLNNGSDDITFDDTFLARWTRSVTLTAGTYSFNTVSDDGVRLWIDDSTGTDLIGSSAASSGGGANSKYIINQWGDHSARLDTGT
ncbi:MAG: hypothetical protein IT319_03960, partial [Anaerolineae bacterium]|nr:hypothetical protein [Anaerolineae bacterium]